MPVPVLACPAMLWATQVPRERALCGPCSHIENLCVRWQTNMGGWPDPNQNTGDNISPGSPEAGKRHLCMRFRRHVVLVSTDRQTHFVQVPRISRLLPAVPQLIRVILPKLPVPRPHGIVHKKNTTLAYQFLAISVTVAETQIE